MRLVAPKHNAADHAATPCGSRAWGRHGRWYLLSVVTIGLVLAAAAAPAIEPARKAELTYLLEQDCGSCHGMTRRGGLGPALLPQNLEGKPNELLIATILEGRPGTAMPPWRGQLTETEAAWLVEQLRQGTE